MKIRKLKKNIKIIEKIILDYFTQDIKGKLLILDDDIRGDYYEYIHYDEENHKKYYFSVTSYYIYKYLLKEKYNHNLVIYCLMNLTFNRKLLKSFKCNEISKIIFTKYSKWGSYISFNDKEFFYKKESYEGIYLNSYYKYNNLVTKRKRK